MICLPAEPEQEHAEPIREELVGWQVFKSPHLIQKQAKMFWIFLLMQNQFLECGLLYLHMLHELTCHIDWKMSNSVIYIILQVIFHPIFDLLNTQLEETWWPARWELDLDMKDVMIKSKNRNMTSCCLSACLPVGTSCCEAAGLKLHWAAWRSWWSLTECPPSSGETNTN